MLAAAGIVLAWFIPCVCLTSFHQGWIMIFSDSTNRFQSWTALAFGTHIVQFPLEVLGCTLPWSLLLVGYLNPALRRVVGESLPQALFAAFAAGFAFVSIWLPPEGQTRYLAPIYPCLAVLIGVVVDCCTKAEIPLSVQWGWRIFTRIVGCTMVGAAVAVLGAAWLLPDHPKFSSWAEPPLAAVGYAAAIALVVTFLWRGRRRDDSAKTRTAVLAVAFFMVLAFTGIVTDARVRRSEDQASAVAGLKLRLPANHRLVSYGHVDLLFEYHYGQQIQCVALPTKDDEFPSDDDVYFCFCSINGLRPNLPFAFEEVANISMERNQTPNPERTVVVGHRISPSTRQVNFVPGTVSP
jgi:hypothetical protein